MRSRRSAARPTEAGSTRVSSATSAVCHPDRGGSVVRAISWLGNQIGMTNPGEASGTVTLGGDLTVNRLGYGAMQLTGKGIWGPPEDHDECIRVLRRAVELGVTFIDPADSYGPYVSEQLIAEALHPYPRDLVIGTKGGLVRPSPKRWDECGHPEHLRQAVDGSLRRLKVDRIDLYQFHAPDPYVPFADSMSTLAELQRAGKIRHLGISNVNVKQLNEARSIAPIVSVQNHYNVE